MGRYVLKRTGLGLLTLFLSFTLTFFLIRFAPGDPIQILAGRENPNPKQIEYVKELYGLKQPMLTQYVKYLSNVLKGDLGFSFRNKQDVLSIIMSRLSPTIKLTLTASTLSAVIGTALGIWLVKIKNAKVERLFLSLSYLMDAIPVFWLGMVLILIFAGRLGWFPIAGMHDVRHRQEGLAKLLDEGRHMVLPVLTLVLVQAPIYMRVIRSSILNVVNENFVQTFHAVGMPESRIFNRYILKNAISPVIILFGFSLAFTISGVALIEIIFAWPGMGRLIIEAVSTRDYMLLNGIYLIISASVVVFMVVMDVVQAIIDPRIRLEG